MLIRAYVKQPESAMRVAVETKTSHLSPYPGSPFKHAEARIHRLVRTVSPNMPIV